MRTYPITPVFAVGTFVTVYTVGGFGVSTERGKVKEIKPLGDGSRMITIVPKGKRKPISQRNKTLVCLAGDHPDAPGGLVPTATGSRSRYGIYDRRYVTDFNKWVNDYIDAGQHADKVLAYQTEEDGETDPTFNVL